MLPLTDPNDPLYGSKERRMEDKRYRRRPRYENEEDLLFHAIYLVERVDQDGRKYKELNYWLGDDGTKRPGILVGLAKLSKDYFIRNENDTKVYDNQ